MRKSLPLVAALVAGTLFLLPAVAGATQPKKVEPSYDAATKTLSVAIRHWSLANGLHHVRYVDVKVNGALVSTTKYKNQPGAEYTYTYPVEAVAGDVIEVTAKCNLWGSRTASITVGAPGEPPVAGQPAGAVEAPPPDAPPGN